MSKVQPETTPATNRTAKQMYRGVITANAVVDVFVRAASDVDASAAIKRGKGRRMNDSVFREDAIGLVMGRSERGTPRLSPIRSPAE
jgi:hypothetical protein